MSGRRGEPLVTGRAGAPAAVRWPVLGVLLVLLLISNIVVNRLLPAGAYVPWNVAITVLLVMIVRRDGLSWADLGLDRATLGRSTRWGLAGAAVVALVYAAAIAVPWTRDLFDDARADSGSVQDLLYHALLQIPLGTVLLEEVAFRGVLPAVLGSRAGSGWRWFPVVGASVLFGLWHVLPSLDLAAANAGVESAVGGSPVLTVTLAVLGTTVAGVFLCWWRWLGRGLLAPVLVHLATNVLGFTLAWSLAG